MKVVDFSQGEARCAIDVREDGDWRPSRYEPSRRPRWVSLGLIAIIHAIGFVALQYLAPEIVRRTRTAPLVVNLLPNTPLPPKPKAVELPTKQEVAPRPTPQQIVAPAPIVETPTIPVIVAATPPAEPSLPAPVKPEESSPPRRTSETTVDLNTKLLSADPPRYPVESRHRRETGTVVLLVVVNEEGRVASISIATSSGVDRLDKAALGAVRRWRWSPTIIDGRPSQVRGFVRIPFELKAV